MREINDFFSKSEKVMTLRYLFQKDGPIIQNYLEINPEDIFIYVSHTVKQADIDKRASQASIIKELMNLVKLQKEHGFKAFKSQPQK